ncbi:MAG: PEP-CTERM sorting domain-containing protein [Limisphaerales bacterium]
MKTKKNLRLILVAAFIVSIAFAQISHAQGELLTFDEPPNVYGGTGAITNGYGGLQWQYFNYLDAVNTGSGRNGMVSSNYIAFNFDGDPAQISDNDGLFNLSSAYLTGAWNDGLQVEVQGFVGGTLTYDNTYTVNTAGPILINFDYLGVDGVNFISFGGTHNPSFGEFGEEFLMDNLTVTLVPEPSAIAIGSLALFSVVVTILRKRQA